MNRHAGAADKADELAGVPTADAESFRGGASTSAPWPEGLRRILCVRLDNMGDVLMTTPALRLLRARFPGARLTLLGSPAGTAAAAQIPEIDEHVSLAAPWVGGNGAERPEECEAVIRRLRAEAFDAAIIFTTCTQSPLPAALLCWLAGIPRRLAHCRENPYHLLSDRVREREPEQGMRHEVIRQLALVAHVGARTTALDVDDPRHFQAVRALPWRTGAPQAEGPGLTAGAPSLRLSFSVSSRNRQSLDELLRAHGIGPDIGRTGPLVVIHPGASAASRRWPAERFGAVARQMIGFGWSVVVAGGSGDLALAGEVARVAGPRCMNLARALGLGELGALLERASLLVANNSGPMHVAAALGTPIAALYALTNPQHVPWQVRCRVIHHDVPCRGCLSSRCLELHHRCLLGVSPEQVVEASIELIGNRSAEHVHAWHQRNLP